MYGVNTEKKGAEDIYGEKMVAQSSCLPDLSEKL